MSIGSSGHQEKDAALFSPLSDTSYAAVFSSEDESCFLSPKRRHDDPVREILVLREQRVEADLNIVERLKHLGLPRHRENREFGCSFFSDMENTRN